MATLTNLGIKAMSIGADYAGPERSYSYTVMISTDVPCGARTILNATFLPIPNATPYQYLSENDAGAICRNLTPSQTGPLSWEVVCNFSTIELSPKTTEQNDNPLNDPIDIEGDGRMSSKVLVHDLDGKAFAASNGEPYSPDVATVDWPLGVLYITRNEPYADYSKWSYFTNKINAGPFYGNAPKTVKCWYPRFRRMIRNGIIYWNVRYSFDVNPGGWDMEQLDAGTYFWEGSDTNKVKRSPTDEAGIATTTMLHLDGAGGLLNPAWQDLSGGPSFYTNTFRKYEAVSFSGLGVGG